MAQRKRIGLVFSYNENWVGGTYYILNIIRALKTLPPEEQPEIVIISGNRSNLNIVKKETAYPFLEFFEFPIPKINYTVIDRIINKIFLTLFRKKAINKRTKLADIDFLYPAYLANISEKKLVRVNWVPDFQELHLPELFPDEILKKRKAFQKDVLCRGDVVVFSSRNTQKDFDTMYPEAPVKRFVLPFAVIHPDLSKLRPEKLVSKYKLPASYYFSPNQFWAHKNHMVILQSLKELKKSGTEVFVAFSGKEDGPRNIDYTKELKKFISENDLESNVRFLGFIPREEQLKLMENALAVVQPSRFEGWSTVVEDSKALGQFIILSQLDVHKEQIEKNVHFFDQSDHTELAEILLKYWKNPPTTEEIDYQKDIMQFAKNFMELATIETNNY